MRVVVVLSVVVIGAGCHDQAMPGAEAPIVREIGGVELVQNPEPAQPDLAADEALTTIWRTEGGDGASEVWQDPVRVRVADDAVHVLDRMANRVYTLDAGNGSRTHTFGRRGEGPGELSEPFGLAIDGRDIVVGDGSKSSLEFFDRHGAHVGSLRLGRLLFDVHGLGSRTFLVSALLGSEGGWVRVPETGSVEPFTWPGWISAVELEDDCFRVGADRHAVYRLSCVDLVYQVVTHDGALVREVRSQRPRGVVSEEALQRHLLEVRRIMAESGLGAELMARQVTREEQRLRVAPTMRGVRKDPATGDVVVWEQQPEELGWSEAIVHVFDSLGHHQRSAAVGREWVDFDIAGGRLFALERDEVTGLVQLVAHDLLGNAG